MNKKILCAALSLGACLSPVGAYAQMTVVKDGRPVAEISCSEDNEINRTAAGLLQDFVKRMTGATLDITGSAGGGDIIIGGTTGRAGEDGFEIVCKDGKLTVRSGGGKGAIYGVVTLLEDYLGVRYYAKDICEFDSCGSIVLPVIDEAQTPAFRYRQTFSYGNEDPIYKMWFRLEDPEDIFADGMWVHTFNRILPAEVYGEEHPEYYSFINGKRQPGDHSQWCLTNPEVFELAVQKIDSIFKANPGMNMISVSQNDGNNTNCSCPACKAVDEYEGSPSGNFIRFMNKLAERFPDKEISTLAYLFTMHPPKHVKPLDNVNIMLCDIDCKREVPLTDNASGRDFVKALEGWAAISNNIFVWDYGINFDNMVSPFPNFHILQKNIQLFHKNHANMLFEQVNGTKGTDFSELRAYMLAKLMWNPYLDADSLMRSFMDGYYGAASTHLYQYLKIMQGALLASGKDLWIYDSPISHKDGMLNANLLKTYDELFDRAEQAVQGDDELLRRVRISRLPLLYSELEIARTDPHGDKTEVIALLEEFRQRAAEYGVQSLNERNNPIADYCELYLKRFLPGEVRSKAIGAKVTMIKQPAERYMPIAGKALTDGLFGGSSYVESWVGWEGRDAEFVIDLGRETEFTTISTDFLHQLGGWVLLPASVIYSVSSDGEHYTDFGSYAFPEDRDLQIKFVEGKVQSDRPVSARYVKVFVKTIGNCPSWHYGVGYPAWFFLDEVIVN